MAGDFWHNLTAENLHSDPEYGVVGEVSGGGCLIHVQNPIDFFNVTPSKTHHIIGVTEPDEGMSIAYYNNCRNEYRNFSNHFNI